MTIHYVWERNTVGVNVMKSSKRKGKLKRLMLGDLHKMQHNILHKEFPLWFWMKYDPPKLIELDETLTFILGVYR